MTISKRPFIRKAQRADLERLQTLYLQLSAHNTAIPPHEAEELFERFKRYDGSEIFVGEGHRGRGYGKATLDFATTHAWQQGCYKVMLMTGSKEAATLEFYRRAGFEQTKTGFQKRR
jgi:GNAT superfamily N-acetyltransferase